MTEQNKPSKRGTRYKSNPFMDDAYEALKPRRKKETGKDNHLMVVSDDFSETGEVVSTNAGFWKSKIVDADKFVKLYTQGVKAVAQLSSSGVKVFEVLYRRVQDQISKDEILLTFPSIDQDETPLSESTFYRGTKELLSKGFIAESMVTGMYYLNPVYMWNGNRLEFVTEYIKAGVEAQQAEKT